jgi:hypothetical protein
MKENLQKQLQEQLYDIHGVWHIPWWQTTAAKIVFIVIILVIGIFIKFQLIRWMRQRTKPRTLAQDAQRRLQKCVTIMEKKDALKFYDEVVHAVKWILDHTTSSSFEQYTDLQLLHWIIDNEIMKDDERLHDFFGRAQMARFAHATITQAEMEQDYEYLKELVNARLEIHQKKLKDKQETING